MCLFSGVGRVSALVASWLACEEQLVGTGCAAAVYDE